MPIRTGFVNVVQHQWHGNAVRYQVWLVGPLPLYTWDSLKASLCDGARLKHTAVTVHTRETKYGEEIVTVELADRALPETEVA